jgi:hypothetical protein
LSNFHEDDPKNLLINNLEEIIILSILNKNWKYIFKLFRVIYISFKKLINFLRKSINNNYRLLFKIRLNKRNNNLKILINKN